MNILNGGKQSDFDKPAGTNCASNIIGEKLWKHWWNNKQNKWNCTSANIGKKIVKNIGQSTNKIGEIVILWTLVKKKKILWQH